MYCGWLTHIYANKKNVYGFFFIFCIQRLMLYAFDVGWGGMGLILYSTTNSTDEKIVSLADLTFHFRDKIYCKNIFSLLIKQKNSGKFEWI